MRKLLLFAAVMILVLSSVRVATAQPALGSSFTVQTIALKDQPAYDLKVSPDGKLAATFIGQTSANLLNIASAEYGVIPSIPPIHLIDLTAGKEVGTLSGFTDLITDLVWSADGSQIATYHRNGDLNIWDVAAGKLTKTITAFLGGATLAFFPDGKNLLVMPVVGTVGQFLVWNIESGGITRVLRASYKSFGEIRLSKAPDNLSYRYKSFAISPDGKHIATSTQNGEVALWDSDKFEKVVVQPEPDQKGMFNIWQVSFSVDGKWLVYFDSLTKQTHLWDIATKKDAQTLTVGNQFFSLSARGDKLAWSDRKAVTVGLVSDPQSAEVALQYPDNLLVGMPQLAFTPDGSKLIVGGFMIHSSEADNSLFVITLN